MELGIALPTSGPYAGPEAIVTVARQAEALGYDTLWTYERLLYPVAGVDQGDGKLSPLPDVYRSTYEPIETLAHVAALTERIGLGTSIVNAPFHTPVVLARRFATLDRLSGGRAIAGIGQGWMDQEFETTNATKALRGDGVDDFVAAMRAAWGPDPVSHTGPHYRIAESLINPKPVRPEGVPVLLGGFSPAAIRRAARIADGLNPIAFSLEQLTGTVQGFRAAAAEAGRDASALTVYVRANVPLTAEALPEDQRPFLGGSAVQVAADLERIAPLAVTQVLIADSEGSGTLDDALKRMEELAAATAGLR
jgi:probable F420-dependent oxidoreductase